MLSYPRISPGRATLLQKGVDGVRTGPDPGTRITEQVRWRSRAPAAHDACPLQTVDPTGGIPARGERFQSGNRYSPIQYDDGLAGSHLVDERAEPVLGLRDRRRLHAAI